ncbi:predicted protein, partial [Nematostella vectensis]
MTSRIERYQRFLRAVQSLQSTPLVVIYLTLIPVSLLWKRLVPPLHLRRVLVLYNLLCSVLSLYSFVIIAKHYVQNGVESLFRMEVNQSIKQALLVYWATKNIELLDTVFMILRHRQRQISFLHVYHHSTILLLSDYCYHFYAWPSIAFMLGLNSFVHIFLYFYYAQSALYQQQRPAWKIRMTELQIVQFVIGLVHVAMGYLYYGFCIYGIFYGLSMLG